MKTITFDEYIYKLIPIEITDEMTDAACDAGNLFRVDFDRAYDAALEAVPADLPGVVAHSGEPIAWRSITEKWGVDFSDADPSEWLKTRGYGKFSVQPLYDHAPAQPDTAAPQEQIAELTHERDLLGTAIADAAIKAGIANSDAPMTGPTLLMLADDLAESAQLAAQAGQEPSKFGSPELQAMIIARATEKDRELVIVQAALEAAASVMNPYNDEGTHGSNCATTIRALDPRVILDGMTK